MILKIRYQLNTIRELLTSDYQKECQTEIGKTLNRLRELLLDLIEPKEAKVMSEIIKPISFNQHETYWMNKSVALMTCDQLISLIPTESIRENDQIDAKRIVPTSRNVFIIHGHDRVNLLSLRTLLKERFNLNPIILNEQASKGRTIIEKFEQEALTASYAFALFTPDDRINSTEFQYLQARPNVIFEIGWFYSRLGRERVAILFKSGTKIHSDLDGITRIQFNESINEKVLEIERELIESNMINIA